MNKPTTIKDGSSTIVRGSTPFVTLKEYGELGDNGKAVMKVSGFDRIVADPKRPLASLAIPIIDTLLPLCRYGNKSVFAEDMATIRLYLSRIRFTEAPQKKTKRTDRKETK